VARDRRSPPDFTKPIRRILVGGLVLLLLALFLLWRIDSPRVERFRAALVDRVVPSFSWAMLPVTRAAAMIEDFQSYTRIYAQNQELRRELQQMKAWREAALQLEQKNARLLDRLALKAMVGTEEEKNAAADTIESLRAQIKTLEAELASVKISRDDYQNKCSELIRQVSYWKKEANKAA
jgi:cell shape-determining protein MreC